MTGSVVELGQARPRENMGAFGWPRLSGQSRAEVQECLLATMAAAASRMEATARVQKEAVAALQSLAARHEHDVVINQLRRVEKAISVLAAFPDERETPLDRPHNMRPLRAGRRRVSSPVEPLTGREVCVLQYLRGTGTLHEIAQELSVSRNTIKSHTKAIYRKLGATGRDDAIRRGKDLGILLLLGRLLLLVTNAHLRATFVFWREPLEPAGSRRSSGCVGSL